MDGLSRHITFLALMLLVARGASGSEIRADRSLLLHVTRQVLVSMARHDPSMLPLAHTYRLTVDDVPSGLSMATPWRTTTGFKEPGAGQYVIDMQRQEVFFMATVFEGNVPELLFGRVKVESGRLSEMELYIDRSKADTGMQFDPEGLQDLPQAWNRSVSASQLPTREELTRIAQAIYAPDRANVALAAGCGLVENGKRVTALVSVETFLKFINPRASKREIARIKEEYAAGKEIQLPCDGVKGTLEKKARILVDEKQGLVADIADVRGMVFANFRPGPEPNAEFPTVFAPDFMRFDQKQRLEDMAALTKGAKAAVFEPMPAVAVVAEVVRFYNGRVQGEHRLLHVEVVGSASPWVGGNDEIR